MSRAVVIGTGVIGASVALGLARDGWDVVSVDRNRAAGHGSTSASSAVVRVHYSTWDGTAFAWEGYHGHRDWADHVRLPPGTPLPAFRETGCVVFMHETNGHLTAHRRFSDELGIPYEVWDAARIAERLPRHDLRRHFPPKRLEDEGFGEPTGGTLDGAVFWPRAGYVTDPMLAAQTLLDAARAAGASVVRGEVVEVLGGARARGVALADGRSVEGDVVVNAAGPGSDAVNRMAGVTGDMGVRTRPLRQEVVQVPPPVGWDWDRDGLVVSDADIACYCRPERGGAVFVGTEGPPCDPKDWREADTGHDASVGVQADLQAMRFAQRVPETPLPPRPGGVVGLYDTTPDWIPIYDRSSLPGFYMACGTSGNQFKNAVPAGRLVAALVRHCEGGGDHDAAPLRWRLPVTGHQIDTGFYSRRRSPNAASSGSVLG